MDMAEPFAETLEPRRERSLIRRWFSTITVFARVAGHDLDTRDGFRGSSAAPRPRGTYALSLGESENRALSVKALEKMTKRHQVQLVTAAILLAGGGSLEIS